MKTSVKILILCLAVILCSALVLMFLKTRVSPPNDFKSSDPYQQALMADVQQYVKQPAGFNQDSAYLTFTDKCDRFYDEQKISPETYDKALTTFVDAFSHEFYHNAIALFNKNVWPKADLNNISTYITQLRSLTSKVNGNTLASPGTKGQLNEIDNILSSYNAALAFINNVSFANIDRSATDIARANEYLQKPYLANNADLNSRLSAVPSKLNNAHFNHIKSLIAAIQYAQSLEDLDNRYNKANTALTEYYQRGDAIYGGNNTGNCTDLSNVMNRYYQDRKDYLDPPFNYEMDYDGWNY